MNFGTDLKSENNIFSSSECSEHVCMYEHTYCVFISSAMFGILNFPLKFDQIPDPLMFLPPVYIIVFQGKLN